MLPETGSWTFPREVRGPPWGGPSPSRPLPGAQRRAGCGLPTTDRREGGSRLRWEHIVTMSLILVPPVKDVRRKSNRSRSVRSLAWNYAHVIRIRTREHPYERGGPPRQRSPSVSALLPPGQQSCSTIAPDGHVLSLPVAGSRVMRSAVRLVESCSSSTRSVRTRPAPNRTGAWRTDRPHRRHTQRCSTSTAQRLVTPPETSTGPPHARR